MRTRATYKEHPYQSRVFRSREEALKFAREYGGEEHYHLDDAHGKYGRPRNRDEVLQRYPRLVAHLICESLGYFSPSGAASAIKAYLDGDSSACEWYDHMVGIRLHNRRGREEYAEAVRTGTVGLAFPEGWRDYDGRTYHELVGRRRKRFSQTDYEIEALTVGKETLQRAITGRHQHRGYMAEYRIARTLTEAQRSGQDIGFLVNHS